MDVSAIIPAYNEEKTIADVLSVVCGMEEISEIIVVSDGSTDNTAGIARAFGVKTIELQQNMGKGYAMKEGLKHAASPVVLFLDADLVGLTSSQVHDLIRPVCNGDADMTLGIFTMGRPFTDWAQKLAPFLTGQRALKRCILDELEEEDWITGFAIELKLTRIAKKKKLQIVEVFLENATHTMKEEKLGIAKGIAARLKMYWEIAKEFNRL